MVPSEEEESQETRPSLIMEFLIILGDAGSFGSVYVCWIRLFPAPRSRNELLIKAHLASTQFADMGLAGASTVVGRWGWLAVSLIQSLYSFLVI